MNVKTTLKMNKTMYFLDSTHYQSSEKETTKLSKKYCLSGRLQSVYSLVVQDHHWKHLNTRWNHLCFVECKAESVY